MKLPKKFSSCQRRPLPSPRRANKINNKNNKHRLVSEVQQMSNDVFIHFLFNILVLILCLVKCLFLSSRSRNGKRLSKANRSQRCFIENQSRNEVTQKTDQIKGIKWSRSFTRTFLHHINRVRWLEVHSKSPPTFYFACPSSPFAFLFLHKYMLIINNNNQLF